MPGSRRQLARTLLAAALAAGAAGPVDAQPPRTAQPPGGELAGRLFVLLGDDPAAPPGAPVAGATVLIGELGRSARSDSAGRFSIAGIPAGTYRVLVRGIGFEPLETRARFADGLPTRVDFGLRPAAPQLTPVVVAERSTGLTTFDEQFARRWGKLIDRAEIEKQPGRRISDHLLSLTASVRIVQLVDRKGFASRQVAASKRGSVGTNGARDCYMTVVLDGITLYSPPTAASFGEANVEPPDINMFDPSQLAAIEVYAGTSQLPAELRGTGNGCGVLRLWTRHR